jgi:hypothetical protein
VHVQNREVEVFAGFEPAHGFERRCGVARGHAPLGGLQAQDPPVRGVVVDDERPLAREFGLCAHEVA